MTGSRGHDGANRLGDSQMFQPSLRDSDWSDNDPSDESLGYSREVPPGQAPAVVMEFLWD